MRRLWRVDFDCSLQSPNTAADIEVVVIGYFGATVGGGVVKNLTLSDEPADDFAPEDNLSFRKYGVPIVAPFVGTELPLTERMNLTVKADYLIPIGNAPDFPSGVRLYVGFMFKH